MRTLLRHGLDHYEVLRADEPLRRGERPVAFHDPGAATSFLERLARSGDGERELRRLAREDFADELAGGTDSGLLPELGRLLASGRLKLVRAAPAVRLRSGAVEYVVLERGDRPRRHESLVKVWDETSAHRFAQLIAWLPPADRNRVLATAAPGAAWSSQRDVARVAARGLASGAILVARVRTLREAGASAPPPAAADVSAFGWRDAASVIAGFIPGVSEATDLATIITGRDVISGEDVGTVGRIAAVIGIFTPFSGSQIRAVGKLFRMRQHALDQALKRGVSEEAIRDALEKPLKKSGVKTDSEGRPSQTFMGKDATVAVNPETDEIVTVWPTSTKRRDKALRDGKIGDSADE